MTNIKKFRSKTLSFIIHRDIHNGKFKWRWNGTCNIRNGNIKNVKGAHLVLRVVSSTLWRHCHPSPFYAFVSTMVIWTHHNCLLVLLKFNILDFESGMYIWNNAIINSVFSSWVVVTQNHTHAMYHRVWR